MTLKFETACGEDFDLGVNQTVKTSPGGGLLNGTQVSISTFGLDGATTNAVNVAWRSGLTGSIVLNLLAGQSDYMNIPVPGALVGDFVLATFGALDPTNASLNISITGYVEAVNLVRVVVSNPNASNYTQATFDVTVLVLRGKTSTIILE